MNKFERLMSDVSDKTLVRRASMLSTQAKIAQESVVNALKQKKSELELKIVNLTDLAPETRDSLQPGSKDWNPEKWAENLQETKYLLWQCEEQLKIAQKTYDEFFAETSDNPEK